MNNLLTTLNQTKVLKTDTALYQLLKNIIDLLPSSTNTEFPIGMVLVSTDSRVPVNYGNWSLISTDITLIVGTTLYFYKRVA